MNKQTRWLLSDRWQEPDEGASETEFLLPTRKLRALKLGRKTTRGTDHALETAGRGPQDRVHPDILDTRCRGSSAFPGPTTNGNRTSKMLPGVTLSCPWAEVMVAFD